MDAFMVHWCSERHLHISTDKLGTGGRRREDSSLSVLVYDVELAEDTDDEGLDDSEEQLLVY